MLPLIRFVVDGQVTIDECFTKTMNHWYGLVGDKMKHEAIETILKTWLHVMYDQGIYANLEENRWEENHMCFTFGNREIKSLILFLKKRKDESSA